VNGTIGSIGDIRIAEIAHHQLINDSFHRLWEGHAKERNPGGALSSKEHAQDGHVEAANS
jgi:hypothetical protein